MAALLLGGGLCGCSVPEPAPQGAPVAQLQQVEGEALGTTWSVKWLGHGDRVDEAVGAVEGALSEVDAAMSTWREDSELARVRAADGPVVVSEATYQVVAEALSIAAASGGAFDPTVQPLVELWGFHGRPRARLPSEAEVEVARAQVGWQRVRLGRDEQGRPTLDRGGTALDLSGIAKGYAVDRVSWALSSLGIADHMVEVGGEVRAHGGGPSGSGWRLGVDRPEADSAPGQDLVAVVRLTNGGLATSGDYRNVRVIDGQRVAHTLDPRTGRPAAGAIASVTVVAPDSSTADALATAIMVLGEEEGLALVEARPQVEALLLRIEGDGFARRLSSGMGDLVQSVP